MKSIAISISCFTIRRTITQLHRLAGINFYKALYRGCVTNQQLGEMAARSYWDYVYNNPYYDPRTAMP